MRKIFWVLFVSILILVTLQSCFDDILGTDEEEENTPPVAVVGNDRDVTIGEPVILDGSDSYDPDDDALIYSWKMLSKPAGSQATLEQPDSIITSFVPDKRGSYQIQLTVSDGKDSHAAALSATADIKVLGTINEDMTLIDVFENSDEPDYAVSNVVNVNANLTVEPGVIIEFGAGARMDIESEGSLVAIGSASEPIIFTGATKTAGSWAGLAFNGNNINNELSYVVVEYGGSNNYSNIKVGYNGGVKINNTTSQYSANYGLDTDNGAVLREFQNNVFSDNAKGSLNIPCNMIGALDSESSYSGQTGDEFVSVYASTIATDQTWPALDAAYVMDGIMNIKSAITVKPGAIFKFTDAARLDIEGDNGELIAIGKADSLIKFLGTQELAGHWSGINFWTRNSGNELTYTEVSHGGSGNNSNVTITYDGAAKITNSKFTMSSTEGVNVESGGVLREFANNTFEADAILRIPSDQIGSLDANSSYIGTAGTGNVEVYSRTVKDNQTWPAIDAPYIVDGIVNIESQVTIEPGAIFKFTNSSRIDVQGDNGEFIAIGTSGNLIRFMGTQEIAGHWRGINFETKNPGNELTYTEISHGGNSNYNNVSIEYNGSAKITNSTFKMSENYGVGVTAGGQITEFSDNDFQADAKLHIPAYLMGQIDENSTFGVDSYISVFGSNVETDQNWVATDMPFRIEGIVNILADVTIAPGAFFECVSNARIDIESGDNGGSLSAVGTSTDSIKFVGVNNVQGYWRGLVFSTKSSDNLMEYCVISNGGASGYSNIIVSYNGSLTVNYSSIRNSENYGVEVESGGQFNESGNTYSNNKMGDLDTP